MRIFATEEIQRIFHEKSKGTGVFMHAGFSLDQGNLEKHKQ